MLAHKNTQYFKITLGLILSSFVASVYMGLFSVKLLGSSIDSLLTIITFAFVIIIMIHSGFTEAVFLIYKARGYSHTLINYMLNGLILGAGINFIFLLFAFIFYRLPDLSLINWIVGLYYIFLAVLLEVVFWFFVRPDKFRY